jgi:Domain of unknown function (DUF4203)
VAEARGGYFEYKDEAKNVTGKVAFCGALPASETCNNKASMVVLDSPMTGCVSLSGSNPTNNAAIKEISQDPTKDLGIYIQYSGGDPQYNFTVEIQCNKQIDYQFVGATFENQTLANGTNITHINYAFISRVGCKYDQLSQIWNWFQSNRWAMFAFLVVVGFTLCLFGRALVRPTLFLVGVFISTCVIMFIFYSTFLKTDTEVWVAWAVLGGSVVVGLLLGYLFQRFAKVGAFALAGWGGFTLGIILYNTFMYKVIGGSAAGYWGW